MKYLLDTHILIWWATDDPKLPRACSDLLRDSVNEVYFSSISIWEVAIKHAKGMLRLPPGLLWEGSSSAGLVELAFTSAHAERVASLPPVHADPFDRALIAQALVHSLTLISQDEKFREYPAIVRYF